MKIDKFHHEFVELIPREPADGIVYVSTRYATAVHLCACGCGTKVVTPLSPAKWSLEFDGDSVSLSPSIGNWQFPCCSHYWIRRDKVQWAPVWSEEKIAQGRRRDAEDLERYLNGRRSEQVEPQASPVARHPRRSVFRWLSDALRGM
jgi:Family of unknown function (DUF6527)